MSRLRFLQAATFGRGLFCVLVAVTLALGAAGCTSSNSRGTPVAGDGETLTESANVIIGRILAVDLPRLQAVVDLTYPPGMRAPPSFAQAELLARTDALEPTARLVGTDLQRGRTLGVRIVSGRPRVGDEVVWPRR